MTATHTTEDTTTTTGFWSWPIAAAVTPIPGHANLDTIETLADDVGRLRRGITPGSSLWHLADRLAAGIETLYWLEVTGAADLVREGVPADTAIALVDRWQDRLLARLRDDLREDYRVAELVERRAA